MSVGWPRPLLAVRVRIENVDALKISTIFLSSQSNLMLHLFYFPLCFVRHSLAIANEMQTESEGGEGEKRETATINFAKIFMYIIYKAFNMPIEIH